MRISTLTRRRNNKIKNIFKSEYNKRMNKKTVSFSRELDIIIDSNEDSNGSNSSVDCDREESVWTSKSNELLVKWKTEIDESIIIHDRKAKTNKILYTTMSIPSIVSPVTASILSPYIPDPFITSLLMLISGLFSALVIFLNFSQKQARHERASNSYGEISINIEELLSTSKKFRTPADITIRSFLLKISAIKSKSPPI